MPKPFRELGDLGECYKSPDGALGLQREETMQHLLSQRLRQKNPPGNNPRRHAVLNFSQRYRKANRSAPKRLIPLFKQAATSDKIHQEPLPAMIFRLDSIDACCERA
jgi:hypothetical protein